jgi:hypothetical protein
MLVAPFVAAPGDCDRSEGIPHCHADQAHHGVPPAKISAITHFRIVSSW